MLLKSLTFLFLKLPIFSSPNATEALPLLSHKHHVVLAESDVRHENLTPIRPPALSHRAAAGTPAKHLTKKRKMGEEANLGEGQNTKGLSHKMHL